MDETWMNISVFHLFHGFKFEDLEVSWQSSKVGGTIRCSIHKPDQKIGEPHLLVISII
jgi:hypothetical protein